MNKKKIWKEEKTNKILFAISAIFNCGWRRRAFAIRLAFFDDRIIPTASSIQENIYKIRISRDQYVLWRWRPFWRTWVWRHSRVLRSIHSTQGSLEPTTNTIWSIEQDLSSDQITIHKSAIPSTPGWVN